MRMPLIDVRLLEGVFSRDERQQLAEGLIDAVVAVKGESFRTETEVLIAEVPVGNWYEQGSLISPESVGAETH
jgi:4-oxalocrotonate tautomerase